MTFDEAFKAACDLQNSGFIQPGANLVECAMKIQKAAEERAIKAQQENSGNK